MKMDEDIAWGFVICIIGILIGILIGTIIVSADVDKLGGMVCEENNHGDFIKFDSDNKKIYCEELVKKEKYDGGYIIIG